MEWIFWIILIIFLIYRLVGKSGRNRYPVPPPLPRDEQHSSGYDEAKPLEGPWSSGQGQEALPDPRSRSLDREVEPSGYEHRSPQRPGLGRFRDGENTPWGSIEETPPRRAVITEDGLRYRVAASPESPKQTMQEEQVLAFASSPQQRDDVLSLGRLFDSPNSIVAGIIMGEVLQRRGRRGRLRPPGQR